MIALALWPPAGAVAVALRGGRGSQLLDQDRHEPAARRWRSPSGAAEDRNELGYTQPGFKLLWRSPSGAAEDRNFTRVKNGELDDVAVALRGGRGSQRLTLPERDVGPFRGGRPPGRPRIATTRWVESSVRAESWRSPSGAAEDRNIQIAQNKIMDARLWRSPSGAAEDRNRWSRAVPDGVKSWRSPSGAAEDRNLSLALLVVVGARGGGRPPGRPRIATPCSG